MNGCVSHVIRLREPWEISATAEGRLVLARGFRRPTGLQEGDRVALVVAGLENVCQIACNGNVLPTGVATEGSLRSEIRHLQRDHNKIEIVLDATPAANLEPVSSLRQRVLAAGLVRLEIQAS